MCIMKLKLQGIPHMEISTVQNYELLKKGRGESKSAVFGPPKLSMFKLKLGSLVYST